MLIAVITVFSGLTKKQGEKVHSAVYGPVCFICMPFQTKEYWITGSTVKTAIKTGHSILLDHDGCDFLCFNFMNIINHRLLELFAKKTFLEI